MTTIFPQIKHVVVVMLENRSLDNLCGWLYSGPDQPALFLPAGSTPSFGGLDSGMMNPSNTNYFTGVAATPVPIVQGVTSSTVPNPDPEETYVNVTAQLYGPLGYSSTPVYPMKGFVLNYALAAKGADVNQIMQAHTVDQVPVLSALATNFAISDAWFASVPSQTWPNRAFAHAGTSNGHVDNGEPADPLKWDVQTIFNVLEEQKVSWSVYSDTIVSPSLTRTMFPKLWDIGLSSHFRGFQGFQDDCAENSLPSYSFVEPSFLISPNDAHPPHDVEAAEQFLSRIWEAVSTSPGWCETLLVITFDEHGGCFDHVLPPLGATPPDAISSPGDGGFGFDRFGVRVPTIFVSPYIAAGTVVRSPTAVPFDHTSILATLRDWLAIPEAAMLSSKRIRSAPTFESVLTLSSPRTDLPQLSPLNRPTTQVSVADSPNDLQKSLVSGAARRLSLDPVQVLAQTQTRQQAIDFFSRQPQMKQQ